MRVGLQIVGHPVDVSSGTVYLTREDVSIAGRMRLRLERRYSTALLHGASGPLGPGWTADIFARLVQVGRAYALHTVDGVETFTDDEQVLPRGGVLRHHGTFQELEFRSGRHMVTQWNVNTGGVVRLLFRAPGPDSNEHLLESMEDPAGNALEFVRDEFGRITTVRQRLERRELAFAYNDGGLLATAVLVTPQDPGKVVARYAYDRAGRLASVQDAVGSEESYVYDVQGKLIEERLRDGGRFTFKYDERGRCVFTQGADGYDAKALRYVTPGFTEVLDSGGRTRIYEWQPSGQVTREVDPLGGVHTTKYDEHGRIVAKTAPSGATTAYAYDEFGNRNKITDPLGNTFELSFNTFHLPIGVTDPCGQAWRFEYDARNRLVGATNPLGSRFRVQYDSAGNPIAVTGPTGAVTEYRYTEFGSVTEVIEADGRSTRYDFDAHGRFIGKHNLAGSLTAEYSALGHVTKLALPDSRVYHCTYDAVGNLTSVTDDGGHRTTYRYACCGRLLERTDPAGHVVRYKWGKEPRRLERVINEHGEEHSLEYDAAGKIIRETGFDGRAIRLEYDPDGYCKLYVNGSGEEVEIRRDAMGRIVEKALPDGRVLRFAYNPSGYIEAAESPDAVVKFVRDAIGRVVREESDREFVETEYDVEGRIAGKRTSRGIDLTVVHGDRARIKVQVLGRTLESIQSNLDGCVTTRLLAGRGRLEQVFARGRLAEQRVLSHQGRVNLNRAFTYDRGGRLAAERSERFHAAYTYDERDHLVAATGSVDRHFDYDHGGQLRSASGPGDEKVSFVYGNGGRLLRRGATEYEYDANGRLTRRLEWRDGRAEEWRFGWDAVDQLRMVRDPSGVTWEYGYDALGRRVTKRAGTRITRFLWDRDALLHELENDHVVASWIFNHDRLCPWLSVQGGRVYSVVLDHLGTPRELVDESGTVAWQAIYDSWGQARVTSQSASVHCPFRFPGQTYDPESGLHYNRYRYYDPAAGRYISRDPIGLRGGLDPYAYARNPVNWVDPLGLAPVPGCGDLSEEEVAQIQAVVDAAGRPLEVVGSAARGERRNPGSDLPFGKGAGEKSDIDYAISPSSIDAFRQAAGGQAALQRALPEVDPNHGITPTLHSPFDGPSIQFQPGEPPVFKPGAS